MSYAKRTRVPVDQTKSEIERVLMKYGADQCSSGWTENKAVIMFRMKNRYIRIDMPLPKLEPKTASWNKKKGMYYSIDKLSGEVRRRWRALLLYVKAKLESVDSGIVSFESAFMAHVVLPNKQTVSEFITPQIEAAYSGGQMPKLLDYGA